MASTVSLACWDYDRALPVLDGRVPVRGFDVEATTAPPGKLFPLAVADAPFDVTELSFASHVIQTSRGENAYIGIPVYLSRAFRHGAIYVRTDAGIETAKDLEGKIVGVPEYAMTLAVWVRGILAEHEGIDVAAIRYRTAGLNEPGRVERLKLDLPVDIDLDALGPRASLNDAILTGELDAIIAPAPPRAFADGDPRVRRLVRDVRGAEQAYYRDTGVFPIMHIVGVRRELAAAHPELPLALYNAFLEARRIAMNRVRDVAEGSANRDMSPWYADAYENAVGVMGEDFWPYGVGENRAALQAFLRYCGDQHLTAGCLEIDEIFYPATLDALGI